MTKVRIYFPLLAALLCSSCIHFFFERPSVTLTSISARPSLQGMDFRFGMEVNNPNGYDLKLEAFTFNLLVNEEGPAGGGIESPVYLPARSVIRVEVPVRTDMKFLGKCVAALVQGRELKYKLEGDALVKAALGEKNFHFSKEGVFTKEFLKK